MSNELKTSIQTKTENPWIRFLLIYAVVYFMGGLYLMILSSLIMDNIFHQPGLGYWASGWLMVFGRFVVMTLTAKYSRAKS